MKHRLLNLTLLLLCTLCMLASCSKDRYYGAMRMKVLNHTSGTLTVSFEATTPEANVGFFAAAYIGTSNDLENSYVQRLSQPARFGTNTYEFSFEGLDAGKEYYVCAMMSLGIDKTTSWGRPVRVVMDAPSYPVPDAVDLGLSVKWSTFDLGAAKSGTPGLYFQWGDINGHGYGEYDFALRDKDNNASYKWFRSDKGSGKYGLTKYVDDNDSGYDGFSDGKTRLESIDDPGIVCVGSGWRMPTLAEWEELIDPAKCRWTWGTNEAGVKGYTVTSKIDGYTDKSIFLPANGMMSSSVLQLKDTDGRYWASQLSSETPYNARFYSLSNRRHGEPDSYKTTEYRYNGLSIRLVKE